MNDLNATSSTIVYLVEHSKDTIAILSVSIALISLLATSYFRYREANYKDNELQIKNEQFELDKKHQISKETYQKVFDKKLRVYKQLHLKLIHYNNKLHNIGLEYRGYDEDGPFEDVVTEEEVKVKSLTDILSYMEENIFFMSEALEKEYRKINTHYKIALKGFEEDMSLGVYGSDHRVIESELMHSNKEFFTKHKAEIEVLYSLIESEIVQLKRDIGFI